MHSLKVIEISDEKFTIDSFKFLESKFLNFKKLFEFYPKVNSII